MSQEEPQLLKAIYDGDLETTEALLKNGANVNIIDREYSWSILTTAIEADNLQLVELLLKYGADVNNKGTEYIECTPLSMALSYTPINKEIVKLLLDSGVDVNDEEDPPLAQLAGDVDIYDTYKQSSSRDRPSNSYKRYVKERQEEVLNITKFLLKHKNCQNIDINKGGPLWRALKCGNREFIKLLIDYGADVNYEPEYGDNLIKLCISRFDGNEMLKYLIDHGYDLNKQNFEYKKTLLHQCCYWITDTSSKNTNDYYLKLIRYILSKKNVDVNIQDEIKRTALICVSANKYFNDNEIDIVEKLLDLGADIYHTDETGKTAMMYAKEKGNNNIVKVLEIYTANNMLKNLILSTSNTDYELANDVILTIASTAIENEEDKDSYIKMMEEKRRETLL